MKGLLIKDFQLMKAQKQFFLIVAALAAVMAFTMENVSFLTGYLIMVMPMFAASTISYDEFDNGNAFLFTMPVNRRGYVLEKYVFGLILVSGAMTVSVFLSVCFCLGKGRPVGSDMWLTAPAVSLLSVVSLSVLLPLQLKFGAEKSRVALFAVVGGVLALCYGAGRLLEMHKMDVDGIIERIFSLDPILLVAAAAAAVVLIFGISIKISMGILEKKEF